MTPVRRLPRLLCALAAAFACGLAGAAPRYSVVSIDPATQGERPGGQLAIGPDGALYGTAEAGGPAGAGTVFRVDTHSRIKLLHAFDGSDGYSVTAGLTTGTDGWLYGATMLGAAGGLGGIFRIAPDGRFELLHSFVDGADHGASGVVSPLTFGPDGSLYGTTEHAQRYPERNGTIFRLTPDGQLHIVHVFGTRASDPAAGVAFGPDGMLYGMTTSDRKTDCGVLYAIAPDGSGFRIVHQFDSDTDGCQPRASLVQGADGGLYGTTQFGGAIGGQGTIFRFDTATQAVEILHTFHDDDPLGGDPLTGLSRDATGTLYGATLYGSTHGMGAVFALQRNGDLRLLHAFVLDGVDGTGPFSPPTPMPDGTLAGTTLAGGTQGAGTVWRLGRANAP
jgi:uncharacterized repeat protein (TIGR03803 family)